MDCEPSQTVHVISILLKKQAKNNNRQETCRFFLGFQFGVKRGFVVALNL